MTVEDWLTINEAAEVIGVHPRTVRRYIKDNRLKVSRVSTRIIRIARSDIDAFLRGEQEPHVEHVHVNPSKEPVAVGTFAGVGPLPAKPASFSGF